MRHWFRVNGDLCLPTPSVPGCKDVDAALARAYKALQEAGFDLDWSFSQEDPNAPLLEWTVCQDEHQPQGRSESNRACREGTCGHVNAKDRRAFREPGEGGIEDAEYELIFTKGGPNAIGYLSLTQAAQLTGESHIEKIKGKKDSVAGEYRDTMNGAIFTLRPSRARNKMLVHEGKSKL